MADVWWHYSVPLRGRTLHAAVREPDYDAAIERLRRDDPVWCRLDVYRHEPFVERPDVSRLRIHSRGLKAWLDG